MKTTLRFVVTRFIEGFLLLLPLLLTYLMVGQLFDTLMVLTTPITDVLPQSIFTEVWAHRLTAAGLLVALFFLAGLAMQTKFSRRIGNWIERTILNRFPPYEILRSLSKRLSGKDAPTQLQPALIEIAPDIRTFAFIVEEHANGDFTVFLPLSPTPGVGTLQVVGSAKMHKLESSLRDALGCVMNWGAGIEALLKAGKAPQPGSGSPSAGDRHG